MALRLRLDLAAAVTALALCGAARAQPTATAAPGADMAIPDDLGAPLSQAGAPRPADSDMAMPDDLGAPLSGTPGGSAARPARLSLDAPIDAIAADPAGKAVLARDLPGLCERPEYFMFKTMSLRRLAAMSHGRLSQAALDKVETDLETATNGPAAFAPPLRTATLTSPARQIVRSAFYPIAHTASTSVRYGGRQIKLLSRTLYRRVAMVIAAM